MKRILLITGLIFLANCAAVSQNVVEPVEQTKEIEFLKSQLKIDQAVNHALTDSINLLNRKVAANADRISLLRTDLSSMKKTLDENNQELKQAIDSANENMGMIQETTQAGFRKHALFLGGFVFLTLLGSLLLYYFLHARIKRGSSAINEIKNVQKKIQEESLKLDNKLLSIIEKETVDSGTDLDHSLVMKVADEVVRIEMNLSRMDKNIKGYKQLAKAVERIKNNFIAQGYEIVDMLGTTYNEGMRINADFVINESLAEGSRIITSITKPQINYQGQMIQKAIVTVSQNI